MGHHTVIQSFPPGATVTVDGRPAGPTPAVFRESGKPGRIYGIKLTKDACEPLFDVLQATETETSSAQWALLWRLPGVKRMAALPDTMWYILRHARFRFADASFVSERVVLTKYDSEDLLPEASLAFEYTKEFDGAGKEFLGGGGHVVHFRVHAAKPATFPLIFAFVQGEEAYVPEPWDPTQLGVFAERETRLSEGVRKGQQKAYRAFRRRNPLPANGKDVGVTVAERSGRESITLSAMTYRPANERETLRAGESLRGWVVLPEPFDLAAPIRILWGDESALVTLQVTGEVERVRPDGVLVLASGETVRLAGVEFIRRPQAGEGEKVVGGHSFLVGFLRGEAIRLEFEAKERNVYGDLLSFVYLGDTLVNAAVVEQGLARIKYQPEAPLFGQLVGAYLSARGAGRGRWESSAGERQLGMELEAEARRASVSETPEKERQEPLEGHVLVIENDSGEAIDLDGFTLLTDAGPEYRFPKVVLAPGAGVRLHSGRGVDEELDLFWGLKKDPWRAGPVKGFLCDSKGTVIDIYSYAGSAEPSSERGKGDDGE